MAACVHPICCWEPLAGSRSSTAAGTGGTGTGVSHAGITKDNSFRGGGGNPPTTTAPNFFSVFPSLCFGAQVLRPAPSEPSKLAVQCPVCPLPMLCASSRRVKYDLQDRYSSTGSCFPKPSLSLLKTGPRFPSCLPGHLIRNEPALGKNLPRRSRTAC